MTDALVPVRLRCPSCHGEVEEQPHELTCRGCGRSYRIDDGIPVMLPGGSDHGAEQARYFDAAVDAEFEIERPAGAPALYARLLRRKFEYAVATVPLEGATVLVVCGGSGMDAEFLASAGGRVVTSDISLGAVRRAQERSRRHGVEFDVVVADVEQLPFDDRSFDVVYVHDGLHHLERPLAGLAEMARVARSTVCLTEPARAAVTAVAVRLGLAQEVEDAGNRVGRVTLAEVSGALRGAGFRVVSARRYAMLYRHEPRTPMRVLSRRALLPFASAGARLAGDLLGRVGNKLAVVAVRS